jgi:hypothetical protein
LTGAKTSARRENQIKGKRPNKNGNRDQSSSNLVRK